MISSMLSTMNSGGTPPNQNSNQKNSVGFLDLAKLLIEKSNLTKGQIFYLIITAFYLFFCIVITSSPTIVSVVSIIMEQDIEKIQPPVDAKHLMYGMGLWMSIGVLYFIAYAVPEIRDRWRIQKSEDDL